MFSGGNNNNSNDISNKGAVESLHPPPLSCVLPSSPTAVAIPPDDGNGRALFLCVADRPASRLLLLPASVSYACRLTSSGQVDLATCDCDYDEDDHDDGETMRVMVDS